MRPVTFCLQVLFCLAVLIVLAPRATCQEKSDSPKVEYKAVAIGADEKEATRKLNALAAEGWEYLGPLGNSLVAFKRSRLTTTPPPPIGSIGLLRLVDLKEDTVAGKWQWKDLRLVSPGTPDARLAFPVRPDGDYHLIVKFKRPAESGGGPILCLPVGGRHVQFALDAYGGQFTALEAVDGAFVNDPGNPTQIRGKHIVGNKTHVLEARVSLKGDTATIQVDLDGKRLVAWTDKPTRFSLHPAWRLKDDRQVGLRAWEVFEFEAVHLRMLSGQPRLLREPKRP